MRRPAAAAFAACHALSLSRLRHIWPKKNKSEQRYGRDSLLQQSAGIVTIPGTDSVQTLSANKDQAASLRALENATSLNFSSY